MGIAYPRELEISDFELPPARHAPFDLVAHMEGLVSPIAGGVVIAHRPLLIDAGRDPAVIATELRELLLARMRDRRPDADQHTWSSFEQIVHGIVKERSAIDADLTRALIEAIDGL